MVQSQQNYIGINGIVTQDLNSIIAELENDFKSIYGENINLESNSSDGQWLNILAQQKIDALDFQVQLYNNLDVDSVVGLPQQVLYKLNGLSIKDFTYSWVYVNVTVSQNVSLSGLDGDIANTDGTGYTVTDMNGNNWILAESVSLVQNDEPYLLLFRAQELGQITALANTITNMSTIVAGVTEVNNPANNFITGQTGETAAEFRTRRNRSLQAPSQGFKESIEGQLLALNDVSDAKVYDYKDNASIDGVQVIVQGGTSNEIGNIIYNNLPPGINTQGAYEATITVNNRNKVLNYDKPNPIPILVKGTIESLTGNENDVDLDYVKQTLASKRFNIGEIAESANITTQLKNILGETGSPYGVELSLNKGGGVWTEPTTIRDSGSSQVYGGAYGGNLYIIVGGNQVSTSADLEQWNNDTLGSASSSWNDICYGDGKFIAVGSNGEIASSSDGATWNISSSEDYPYILNGITYGGDSKFIAVGNNEVILSSDGVDWSEQIQVTGLGNRAFKSIAYGNNKYVVVGSQVSYSTDGEDWAQSFNINGVSLLYDVCYGDSGFVAVGKDGVIATSSDAISWTVQQVGTAWWNRIKYTNGLYIAVADNSYIATSPDAINWTVQQINENNDIQKAIITNDNLIAVIGTHYIGANGISNVSSYEIPDISWQEILTPTGLADFFVMTVDGMDDLEVIA